jgi:predicted enzyme related to lactoylglutathione lyase
MIKVRGIHAVVVFARDVRRLAEWYKSNFDCREMGKGGKNFVGLHLGKFSLFIQKESEGHAPGMGGIRPHFTVEDCEFAYRSLLAAGAKKILAVTDTTHELVAAVQDPEGNPIGLLQPKKEKPV